MQGVGQVDHGGDLENQERGEISEAEAGSQVEDCRPHHVSATERDKGESIAMTLMSTCLLVDN